MGALTSSANMISYLRDKTLAQWVALNQIANLRLSGQQPPTGTSHGDTDFAGRSWHWRQEVVATEVPGVERIDISVRPAEVKAGEDNGWFTTVSGIWAMRSGRLTVSSPTGARRLSAGCPRAPAGQPRAGHGATARRSKSTGTEVSARGFTLLELLVALFIARSCSRWGMAPSARQSPAATRSSNSRRTCSSCKPPCGAGTGLRAARPASGAPGHRG